MKLTKGNQKKELPKAKANRKESSSSSRAKTSRKEELVLALRPNQKVTGKRLPPLLGHGANCKSVRRKSLPYAGRLNLLFKAGSAKKLHESSFKVLRPPED